ncbi:MAG: DUF2911 domain-containing protein [Terriglobales bacterium]
MHQRFVVVTFILLGLVAVSTTAFAQEDKSPPLSPPAQAQCKLTDGKTITIDYSSPRAKGRKIYGGLVPFGKVWRIGANEATTFVSDADLTVGGKAVPASSYTIFAVPNPDQWSLIINKKTGEWGTPYKYEADELLRTEMKVAKTPLPFENLTIGFDQKGKTCLLRITWENTEASIMIHEN